MFQQFSRIIRTWISRAMVFFLGIRRGVQISPECYVKGWPDICIFDDGKIILGEGVVLNSSRKRYHVGLYGPVRLIANGSNAIIEIGSNTRIHGSSIQAKGCLKIGANCLIAANCQILDNNGHDVLIESPEKRINTHGTVKSVTIEDDVWVGMNSIILPGSTIRRGAVIAAGSIVRGEIPENALFASPSGSVVKQISKSE